MRPFDPRLLRVARSARRAVAGAVVLGTATAAVVLVQAEVLSRAVARLAADPGAGVPVAALVALAVVVGVRAAIAWAQEATAQRAAAGVKEELRRAVVNRAASIGADRAHRHGRAAVANLAVRGLDALDPYFGRYLPQLVLAAVVPAVVTVRIAAADRTAAVTVALTLPLIPVFMVLVGRFTEASNRRQWATLQRLSHHLLDVLAAMPTLVAYGRERAQAEAVRRSSDRARRATMATLRVAFLSSLVLELVATLSVALVAVGIGVRLVGGSLDLRTGLLVLLLAPEVYLPLRQVGAQYHASAEGLAAVEDAFAVLDRDGDGLPPGDEPVPDLRDGGALVVDGLTVRRDDRTVAAPDGVSFEVRPGETVVLAGPSGCGKSTTLAAVLGLVTPSEGTIEVRSGGRATPLAALDRAAWHASLAWVPQHPVLLAGSVADNVRLADPAAPDAEVERVLALVGLPGAGQRRVGEAGAGLSAGERRRVAVARALVRDVPLLVLDEPTGGLDERLERELLAAVRTVRPDAAVLMVAHRPAALDAADRIVVLGAAAEVGP